VVTDVKCTLHFHVTVLEQTLFMLMHNSWHADHQLAK